MYVSLKSTASLQLLNALEIPKQTISRRIAELEEHWTMVYGNLTAFFPSRRMLSLPVRTFLDEMVNIIHQLPPTVSLEDLESAWSSTEFIAHTLFNIQVRFMDQ